MTKLFLDANVLIDISDSSRAYSEKSAQLFDFITNNLNDYQICTSCDLLTTVYYILRRKLDKTTTLQKIKIMNSLIKVIEFGNKEIDEAIYLMDKNKKFSDLEDTIQFVMARKERCDYIITNDKEFYSHEVPLLSSEEAIITLTSQQKV